MSHATALASTFRGLANTVRILRAIRCDGRYLGSTAIAFQRNGLLDIIQALAVLRTQVLGGFMLRANSHVDSLILLVAVAHYPFFLVRACLGPRVVIMMRGPCHFTVKIDSGNHGRPDGAQPLIKSALKLDKDLSQRERTAISTRIVRMLALDLQPYSCVEKRGFKELMNHMKPLYKIPSLTAFSRTIILELYRDTVTGSQGENAHELSGKRRVALVHK
ncbi:hypothetical protein HPB50_025184 [Hyalomma asiaticum]|uniref:Uncharacterized protein n=1 Tax=Hyalomma asiaticum TaxID=266040 RepID=A0ACB7TQY4_HYAAI|nr:hypothetical protein HPB50_025184 [Hyalomma asiaticum]